MALAKYLAQVGGRLREIIPVVTSAGAVDKNKIIQTGANGKIDMSLLPDGVGDDVLTLTASEALAEGDLVVVWSDAGTTKVRKADATTVGKEAVAFTAAAVSAGDSAPIRFDGTVSGLTGLVAGQRYYLSTTAGRITATPPAATGNVVQYVGRALSPTELTFEPGEAIELA